MLSYAQTCCGVIESMDKEKVTSLTCFKLRLMHQTLSRHIRLSSDTDQTLAPIPDSDFCIKPA
jgi:hypothetical protein